MHMEGDEVEQSDEEAFKWFSKSAELGHAKARYRLEWMRYNGEGRIGKDGDCSGNVEIYRTPLLINTKLQKYVKNQKLSRVNKGHK
ncbi:hypothetical protein AGMMS49921_01820 [Endomicrobiia bacterium]|nr:hypothetical protein AGMMS49921_01820 [Endomicrobiia bacterium]